MLSPRKIMQRIDARLARHGSLGAALIKGIAGSTGVKLVFSGVGFITAVVLARSLGATGYGTYSFVMALVAFLAIPSELGIPGLAVREVAVANARKDWGHMRGLIVWAHWTTGKLSLALMGAGAVALLIWGDRLDPVKLKSMWLGLLLVPLVSLGALRGAMLRGLRKAVLGQLPEKVVRPVAFLAILVALLLVGVKVDSAVDAMLIQVTAATLAFGAGVYLFIRNRPPGLVGAGSNIKASSWLRSSIPFAMTAALRLINGRTDILALGIFQGSEDVGVYRVSVQFAMLVIFGMEVVNIIQAPHIAHLFATGDMQKLQKMVTRTSQVMCVLAIAAVVVILLFGEFIIQTFFGHEFKGAFLPLVILCVGQLVNATMGSVASLLNMTGHERDTMKGVLIGAVVNIVLNVTLTPLWGMAGAAVATAVTLITWNVYMRHLVRLRIGIETSPIFRQRR